MIHLSLLLVAAALVGLALFVWRANKNGEANRGFAICSISLAAWTVGIAGTYSGVLADISLRLTFAGSSLAASTFLAFVHSYPIRSRWPSIGLLRITHLAGVIFAVVAFTTEMIAYQPSLTSSGLARKTGVLYPFFAIYCSSVFCFALALLVGKWRVANGLGRLQLQYLGIGALVPITGGLTTNLLLPIVTNHSAYGWLGPYFLFPFVLFVAHAIIRHRLMDLSLVIHQGLTVAMATMMSLCPVVILLIMLWPQLSSELETRELVVLLAAIVMATLLVPPTRDIAGKLIDRYAYRTHTNFQKTVRDASRRFTRYLDLRTLLGLIIDAVGASPEAEGVAVYLANGPTFSKLKVELRHRSAKFLSPEITPATITAVLTKSKDLLIVDEFTNKTDLASTSLHAELRRLNWALVLPLMSEDTVIGFIALGPKLSGDPFYPQDL
ncbi:MAG TPA: histidine kinase N-terminal 7TM domain-containing protein, partial [Methylomirabilota bacterium]